MTNAATDTTAQAGMGDLAEIFYAPSAVFARRTDGKFGMPYLALMVIGIVLFFATKSLVQPVIDAVVSASIQKGVDSGKIPAASADSAISIGRTVAMVLPLFFYVVGPFLVGLFLWINGKVFKVSGIGSVAIMVATFSMFPRLIGGIASAILIAVSPEGSMTNPAQLSVGPGHFLGADTTPLIATLAGRFDLFIIWGVILMAIGLRASGKASKQQAWSAAIGTWAIITLVSVAMNARNG